MLALPTSDPGDHLILQDTNGGENGHRNSRQRVSSILLRSSSALVCGVVLLATGGCSDDPTRNMSPAPGATSQQPSDGTAVAVDVITPEKCPTVASESGWGTLTADGVIADKVKGCRDEGTQGVYSYSVRMQGIGSLIISQGQIDSSIDVARALESEQVSLYYTKDGSGKYVSRVDYAIYQ